MATTTPSPASGRKSWSARRSPPCLQYQYASGKNTADIALALDALEALFDHRADTFCLVTSDSDFSYLCRKLRERGATVFIVGEPKTPDALRNACDQFFEWDRKAKEAAAPEVIRPGFRRHSRPSLRVAPFKLYRGQVAS
nr:NYN domain-containing protein [Xanthomonas arboricola]